MKQILLLAVLSTAIFCSTGIDYSVLASQETLTCLRTQYNVSYVIPRGYRSIGVVDANIIPNMNNARAAGIPNINPYFFPCRSKSASGQINELVTHLSGINYTTIWLDIETNPSTGCSWSTASFDANCQYVADLITAIKAAGKQPAIYATAYMWTQIFGSTESCKNFSQYPLWYAHYDNTKSFSDFKSFGGWTAPVIKQYGGADWCNLSVDCNWNP